MLQAKTKEEFFFETLKTYVSNVRNKYKVLIYFLRYVLPVRHVHCTVGWIKFLETVASHGACSECVETLQK